MENNYFKAVGVLIPTKILIEDSKHFIFVDGCKFELYYQNNGKGRAIKEGVELSSDSQLQLIVYPRITHFPQREKDFVISFQVVAYSKTKSSEIFSQLNHREFFINGIYQKIPVCQTPTLSIYKNFNQKRFEFFKKSSLVVKKAIARAIHIPINFSHPTKISPFRYDKNREEKVNIPFISVKAKFNPESKTFCVDAIYGQTTDIPKHIRPPRIRKERDSQKSQSRKIIPPPSKNVVNR